MEDIEVVLRQLIEAVKNSPTADHDSNTIPVGNSNRHVHLSMADVQVLFGTGYQMVKMKDLSQPGQYACKETVTICGPKGAIEKVRVLGPERGKTQVEILGSDQYKLGVKQFVRASGDLEGTPGITIIGPKGSVQIDQGVIVAQRHIHMHLNDAKRLGVQDGEIVSVQVEGERGGILNNVCVRADNESALEIHLDIDEANALGVSPSTKITIVK